MKMILFACLFVLVFAQVRAEKITVTVSSTATAMENYAGRELCRYISLVSGQLPEVKNKLNGAGFIIGRPGNNKLIDFKVDCGPQGYTLKKVNNTVFIAANDEVGVLYGVYAYLEDYLGVHFSFDGDIYKKTSNVLVDANETKTPAVAIRGLLPWTNFPQSATSYSWEDWKFILDQMAKMRLNFIQIHNYNGEEGHNEMFHNFELDGQMSRVWMATAKSGHAWGSYPGWDVSKYCFGSSELFDDYDFGADCALHNEKLDNRQVFRKGANEFQRVIAYAHTRGIKIGLGLDINLIPEFYKVGPDDPRVIAARVKQIETDYPDLDYLFCFQSEGLGAPEAVKERQTWRNIFDGFYSGLKKTMPNLRLAVAGWGIRAEDVNTLPADVICAPISYYSDAFENGSAFGTREYWGCPWLERDFNSSVYYYPYNMNISNTIKAWQDRAPNMKGFYALTWRITDAVKAKVQYMAEAPWDNSSALSSSEKLYAKFAIEQYGSAAAKLVLPIINQNEPFASDFSECRWTPPFSLARVERSGGGYLMNVLSFKADNGAVQFASEYTRNNETKNGRGPDGKECVGYISAGSWLAYENVSLDGFKRYRFSVSSDTEGGVIEIRLDGPEGLLIGSGIVNNTGGWQEWKDIDVDLKPTTGTHTIYLVFRELAKDLFNLAMIELDKARTQIATIDQAINITTDPGQKYRLNLLKSRICAERDHILLNMFAGNRKHDINAMAASWVGNFNDRATDISSLGNVVSVQNRFIHNDYIPLGWKQLNTYNTIAPENVFAQGTANGVLISWIASDTLFGGFDIYRDGKKINEKPLNADVRQYEDKISGQHTYEVYVRFYGNDSSNNSVKVTAVGGEADNAGPQIVMISPPTSVLAGQPVWIKARLLANRTSESLSATLHYRKAGSSSWFSMPMNRRIRNTFTSSIDKISAEGIEYYISASDGKNESVFPASGYLSCIQEKAEKAIPGSPVLNVDNQILSWQPVNAASYFKIYRLNNKDFKPGPENYLTYLSADAALNFTDNGKDFKSDSLKGDWYYRVTAVDKLGYESAPSDIITIKY